MKHKSIPEERFYLLVQRKAHVLDMSLIQATDAIVRAVCSSWLQQHAK